MSRKLNSIEYSVATGDSVIINTEQSSSALISLPTSGTYNVTVSGCGSSDNNFTTLMVVDYSSLSAKSSITASGQYLIITEGLFKIKITLTSVPSGATMFVNMNE